MQLRRQQEQISLPAAAPYCRLCASLRISELQQALAEVGAREQANNGLGRVFEPLNPHSCKTPFYTLPKRQAERAPSPMRASAFMEVKSNQLSIARGAGVMSSPPDSEGVLRRAEDSPNNLQVLYQPMACGRRPSAHINRNRRSPEDGTPIFAPASTASVRPESDSAAGPGTLHGPKKTPALA